MQLNGPRALQPKGAVRMIEVVLVSYPTIPRILWPCEILRTRLTWML